MIELPEAVTLAKQLNSITKGKKIKSVIAASSPHKFAWYFKDPQKYSSILVGKTVDSALSFGGMVELHIEDTKIVLADGVGFRFHSNKTSVPKKHQLLIEFEGDIFLSASIQMYGGIFCFLDGQYTNKYYKAAKEKPSPIHSKFTKTYFNNMISHEKLQKKSIKFVLATEQRIPGLGNGVLQDILFNAKLNPKRKLNSLSEDEKAHMFDSIKSVLKEMSKNGGRDTEKDLFGNSGKYITKCSKFTVGKPCIECKSTIVKESYMGGSIYYCKHCQNMG